METKSEKPIDNSVDNEMEVKISELVVTPKENNENSEGIKDSDIIESKQRTDINHTFLCGFYFK